MTQTRAKACPFCPPRDHELLETHALAVAIKDSFPLTRGHSLVVPRRHVASFFELTAEERLVIVELLDRAKAALEKEYAADGYNIGINDGAAAGETVMH